MITPSARHAIAKAERSAAALRADLMALNTALTTAGNSTMAERLAHDALLRILTDLGPVRDRITNLNSILNETNPNENIQIPTHTRA